MLVLEIKQFIIILVLRREMIQDGDVCGNTRHVAQAAHLFGIVEVACHALVSY
jgi:hypothetical protein